MKSMLITLFFFLSAAAGAQDLGGLQQAFNAAAAKAGPAVVSVQVVKEETQSVLEPDYYFGYALPSERTYRWRSAGIGSGVIIDPRGYVLTNRHVVEDAVRIRIVTQDAKGVEKTWMAEPAGADPALDVALLKIKGGGVFPYLELNGDGGLKVGDFVLAVGYPFGFKQTVTSGIISALNAALPVEGRKYEGLIQTDAAINQGNSGGPLLNLKGEVIGLNTAIASPTGAFAGMGFAIPAAEIKKVLPDLAVGRSVRRGWLGVSLLPVDEVMAARLGLPSAGGAIINYVAPGSPAAAAGLKRGDVVLGCDGSPVDTDTDIFYRTYSGRPGDEMELSLLRGGSKRTVRVKLGERPEHEASAAAGGPSRVPEKDTAVLDWEGVRFAWADGARVDSVGADSRLSGYLRRGDIVKAVNGAALTDAAAMKRAFSGASLAEGVVLDLSRDGVSTYLSVQSR